MDVARERFCVGFRSVAEKTLGSPDATRRSEPTRGEAQRMSGRPILFVSNPDTQCGVYQFGRNVAGALAFARAFRYEYVECAGAADLDRAVAQHSPRAIIYNHHPSTMPWLDVVESRKRTIPQFGVFHEVTQRGADGADRALFDFHIAPDPTLLLRNSIVFKTGRLVPRYATTRPVPTIPTIGSFGFATRGKGFERLVREVQRDFDEAEIRLHIPSAHFGDQQGEAARAIVNECRASIHKPGIRLVVTHDFLTNEQVLDFLAGNSINVFLYEDAHGRGISSVIDYALAVDRPFAVSTSTMFRHVHDARPSIVVGKSSIREILARGSSAAARYRNEWTPENLAWDYDRIVGAVLSRHHAVVDSNRVRASRVARTAVAGTVWAMRTGLKVAVRVGEPVLSRVAPERTSEQIDRLVRVGRRVMRRVEDVGVRSVERNDWVPGESATKGLGDPIRLPAYARIGSEASRFNRILDDAAREELAPATSYLARAAPDVIARKIPRANVQQAFVLDAVTHFATRIVNPRLLCVGSYEDTASMALIAGGADVLELDPVVNYDITTFVTKPDAGLGTYDVVFSTSVIEHVVEDEAFATACASLLKPGGVAVLTCDFREGWRVGDPMPKEDQRLYTTRDLLDRVLPAMSGCELVDEPSWTTAVPDFEFGGTKYSFATLVVRKRYEP